MITTCHYAPPLDTLIPQTRNSLLGVTIFPSFLHSIFPSAISYQSLAITLEFPMNRLLLTALALLITFSACDDSSTDPPLTPQTPRGLYILNEGNFQRGNASLSFYIPDSNTIYNDLFQSENGRLLGDVGNSITMHEGLAYLVINNSHKIEVINASTYKSVRTIASPAGASPRQITFAANGYGFISNLFDNSVSVYNPSSGSLEGKIAVGANPDGIAAAGNVVVVANSGFGSGNTVSLINADTRQILKTVPVGDYPSSVLALSQYAAAVICTGDYGDFNDPNDDTPGMLYILDLQTRSVADSLVLGGHPQRLVRDTDGYLYTIQGDGVMRIHLASKTVAEKFIPGFFYNIFIDTTDRRIYLTNPIDYVQPGTLEIYLMNGTKDHAMNVGIIPGAMALSK
jgi:YVTN family beta-propeller protein